MKITYLFGASFMLLAACNSNPVDLNSLNQTYYCEPSAKVKANTLRLINQARSVGRYCGAKYYAATTFVRWNQQLTLAAKRHSDDMAGHNFFSHKGSDGNRVSVRATRAGYRWRNIAENIHAGSNTTTKAVADLIQSAGHCENIMNPNYQEMGAACSRSSATTYVTYYTQTFGRGR
jgi:uncharacterized protein YkwD